MRSQILLSKVVKRQFSRNVRWSVIPGKLPFSPNDPPVVLRNWQSDFLHSYLKSLWTFWQFFSLMSVIICSIFALLRFFQLFVFTDILDGYLICTTTSVKYQKHICQKIKPSGNYSWVTFKLPYSASVLLIDSDLLYICDIGWLPEKLGF